MDDMPNHGEPSRIRFIDHKGKSILLQDFSNLKPGKEFYAGVQAARQIIAAQPPKSVLTLFDATNSEFDADVVVTLKKFVQLNTPFMKYTAVVGMTGLKKVGLMAVTRAAKRPLRPFDTREEALEFLANLA